MDSAVRSFINDVDLVIVGADAVTVNGAVVNKIGTAQVAHSAREARVNRCGSPETYKFAPVQSLASHPYRRKGRK